jgi:hypothetical protein
MPIVYRLNILIFWFTNHVHALSFNGLHVNNSVEILKPRLKNCLCALSLSGLPFKPHLPPVSTNAERKERTHFHQRVGPYREGFKIRSMQDAITHQWTFTDRKCHSDPDEH